MILCVDSDPSALRSTQAALAAAGFETRGVETAAEACEVLAAGVHPDCLVTEYKLSDGTGLDLVREIRETAPDAPCVLFTDVPVGKIDSTAAGRLVVEYQPKEPDSAHEELVDLVEHSLAFKSQTAYPLPENEEARVAALQRYATDSQALDDAFDRLTDIAAELFQVDTVTVGLVDDHQELFISCRGSSYDPMAREDTICTYAILDDEVFVVEDTQEDPRFSENDALVEANIRSYAGAPLVTPTGEAIGAFCLHHDEPRTFTGREEELLTALADEAMDQLELRHQLQAASGGDETR
jgi:CheY-like chemotaxis protein